MANNMMMNRRMLIVGASSLALAGCGGLGLGPTDANNTIYVLQPTLQPAPQGGTPVDWALAVDLPTALDSVEGRRITLIKPDGTMDYYANAQLPDRVPVLVQTALISGFQSSGRVPSVGRIQDALHADYELGVEVRDFSAHYDTQDKDGRPGGVPKIMVSLICQMSTSRGRKIVANFSATQSVNATENSTGAVVKAMSAALTAAVQQIVGWALTMGPPPSATP